MALIVAVDDDPEILALIGDTLPDHEVLTATDGKSGLALVRAKKPAVVLLDITMPGGMSGLQVCEAIKSDPALAGIQVMMLTGQGAMQEIEKGFSHKADDYIVKPFSPRVLAGRVDALLKPKA